MAFLGLLPAPGGRTEELGGTDARRHDHRRPKGPSPGGEGFLLPAASQPDRRGTTRERSSHDDHEGRSGEAAESDGARRSHVPGDGTANAAAVEQRPEGDAQRRPAAEAGRGSGRTSSARPSSGRASTSSSAIPGGVILPALRRPRRLPRSSATSSSATSRAAPTPPTATPASPAASASAWARPARAPRTSSPASAPRSSTRSRWSRSPATSPARSSARTRSRRSTSTASRCR